MVEQRDLLAREVDEELRREQLLKLWERFGTYIVAVAALIIIGVGGFKFYQHRSALAAEAAGARFVAASQQIADNKAADARKALEDIAATGPAGYATLARLRIAAAEQAAGKTSEAATEFEAIANARGVDPLLRDFARLQVASLRLDTANWTDMQNRLNDLAAEENAWRYSARELLGLAAMKAGKTEEARQEFQRLVGDRATPPGIGERARVMMSVIAQAEIARSAASESEKTTAPETPVQAKDSKPKAKAEDKKTK